MTRITPEQGIAIVTGAGSGLGRALAVGLAAQGFTVAGLGRRLAALEETRALAGRDRFEAIAADIGNAAAVAARIAELEARRPVALLINNAAVYPRRDFLDETGESFMATVAVNLGGPVACTRAVLSGMVARGQGRILNVSTFADIAPLPASAAYAVSKGAGRILTRALVADLGDRFPGIVISDWMPGMLATGMGLPDGLSPEVAARWGVALALDRDPALNGSVFEMDREILAPRSLKQRIKDTAMLRRRPRPRRVQIPDGA